MLVADTLGWTVGHFTIADLGRRQVGNTRAVIAARMYKMAQQFSMSWRLTS